MPRYDVLSPETLLKQPGESRIYEFDFALFPEIVAGETLSGSISVSHTPNELTVSGAAISGTKVQFRVAGGTLGAGEHEQLYRFSCRVTTSGGNILEMDGNLVLVD